MKQRLVIWGASGHALVVADIVRIQGDYEIVGFLDDANPERLNEEFCGSTILGGQEQLDLLQQVGVKYLIFGFGDCQVRLKLSKIAYTKGFRLATAVHPRSIIANDVSIGSGTVIAAGAAVNPGTRIGENVIINSCASVDHEGVIGDGVHVGPGVHIGGRVRIERGTWIGIGSTIRDNIHIGASSIIGAGAVVLDNIPEGVVAYGVPAKIIKRIKSDDR